MQVVYLSTTYLGPIQQYCKFCEYDEVRMETAENYLKQTYRNRCVIASAGGPLALSVPIEKTDTLKCLTKDIRISNHGHWRHLHWNALVSAYNMSPFFEYYEEDFAPFYQKKYEFLFDFNEELQQTVCRLLDLAPNIVYTTSYLPLVDHDFREAIRPKHEREFTCSVFFCIRLPGWMVRLFSEGIAKWRHLYVYSLSFNITGRN